MQKVWKLGLEDATAVLDAAQERARRLGVDMALAVVDDGGHLVAFRRMDGAKVTSVGIAIDKAFTAAGLRFPTRDLESAALPGQGAFGLNTALGGRMLVLGGGVPLTHEGQCVGAVGASSGTREQDHEVALAGAQALRA